MRPRAYSQSLEAAKPQTVNKTVRINERFKPTRMTPAYVRTRRVQRQPRRALLVHTRSPGTFAQQPRTAPTRRGAVREYGRPGAGGYGSCSASADTDNLEV